MPDIHTNDAVVGIAAPGALTLAPLPARFAVGHAGAEFGEGHANNEAAY